MSKSEDFIKSVLDDSAKENYGKELGNLSTKALSDNLSRVFVKDVLDELGFSDAAECYEEGYVDGGGDLGADLIIKVGDDVHIIQTKYAGFARKIPREHIDTFRGLLERLANNKFNGLKNGRLDEIAEEIDWESDSFHLWFVTNVSLEAQAQAAAAMDYIPPQDLKEKYGLSSDRVTIEYVDQNRLYEILTQRSTIETQRGVDGVKIYATKLPQKGRSNLISLEENGLRTILMVINSEQIARYARGTKSNLFDFNIRNYLGENKKNAQILKTAKEEPENFFLYNNGVSAICEEIVDINEDQGFIEANKFSVINGAQTVRSLAKLKGEVQQPKVLLRITEIPNHKERSLFLKEIVRFNNTQNEIKSSDFRSNDPIQQSIKDSFSKLTKKGNRCDYFPKRMDGRAKNKNTFKIDMPNFAKNIFCYLYNPYEVQGAGSGMLFDTSREFYGAIFGKEDGAITKDDFLQKAGIYFAGELVDSWIKIEKDKLKGREDEETLRTKNALERKHIVIWLLHLFLQRIESDFKDKFSEKIFLRKLAETVEFDISSSDNLMSFLRDCLGSIKTFVIYEHKNLASAKGMTQRQWIRGTLGVKEHLEGAIKDFPMLTSNIEKYIGKV